MAGQSRRWRWVGGGLLAALGLIGCSKSPPPAVAVIPDTPATTPAAPEAPTAPTTPTGPAVPLDPKLHQPFELATVTEFPNSGFIQLPPDQTLTGKSTGKLHDEVAAAWNDIHFATPDGRPIGYTATLDTELGPVELEFLPELAPNHVRNFLALARCGYYDGLVFERIVRQQSNTGDGAKVELIEAGCPLGTGEPGIGHLGYCLKAEFNEGVKHAPGVVGACHEDGPDTAGTRFYIALTPAPVLDGSFTVFARVKSGLEVASKIAQQPVRRDTPAGTGERPEKPVVIRKVTVQAHEGTTPAAKNG
jgi:cyclophilin family peptidyl-prolyl cis-trans isomerase